MVAANKQKILTKLLNHLGKLYEDAIPKELNVLDHLLLGLVQEGASFSKSLQVYRGIKQSYYNFNELRVSHVKEIVDQLESLPDREIKARRLLEVLQYIFETTYSFDLESMRRKPLKQAQKQLSKIPGVNAYVVAATVQRALGGHSLPIDAPMCDALSQLDLISSGETPEEVRTSLEHLVPKAKGVSFCLLMSELANDGAQLQQALDAVAPKGARRPRAKAEGETPDPESAVANGVAPLAGAAVAPAPRSSSRRTPREKK